MVHIYVQWRRLHLFCRYQCRVAGRTKNSSLCFHFYSQRLLASQAAVRSYSSLPVLPIKASCVTNQRRFSFLCWKDTKFLFSCSEPLVRFLSPFSAEKSHLTLSILQLSLLCFHPLLLIFLWKREKWIQFVPTESAPTSVGETQFSCSLGWASVSNLLSAAARKMAWSVFCISVCGWIWHKPSALWKSNSINETTKAGRCVQHGLCCEMPYLLASTGFPEDTPPANRSRFVSQSQNDTFLMNTNSFISCKCILCIMAHRDRLEIRTEVLWLACVALRRC